MKQIRWKYLLAVFKIKRLFQNWYGSRKADFGNLIIATDNLKEYEGRSQFRRHEPETVEWINAHASIGSIFYDIGANIGACSLLGARLGAKVIAFEPASQNVYKINKNASLNKLPITVLPIALAEKNGLINSYEDMIFGVTHTFMFGKFNEPGKYVTMALDDCIKTFGLPYPTMMKIDVDGAEMDVLKGARATLANQELTDIIIEIDDKNMEVIKLLERYNFKLISHTRIASWCANYVFKR